MSKARINQEETVLLSQTATDRYLRVIKVCHRLKKRYGSAANAAKALIESSEEFQALERLMFPMCQGEDSSQNGRNVHPKKLSTPVCDMTAAYAALRGRSDNRTSV